MGLVALPCGALVLLSSLNECVDILFERNPGTDDWAWRRLAPFPIYYEVHRAIYFDKQVLVTGGDPDDGVFESLVYVFDPPPPQGNALGQWTSLGRLLP